MTGQNAVGSWRPDGLRGETVAVVQHWSSSGALSDQTQLRMAETIERFAARLTRQALGSFADVDRPIAEQFIRAVTSRGSAPRLATMHARRTALRTLYRSLRDLGLADGDPTLDVVLPPRGDLVGRPLTDDEVALARLAAYGHRRAWTPRRAVTWALAEATAVSSEISRVRWHDIDAPASPTRVRLAGTRRHDARTALLTPWASQVLARHHRERAAAGDGDEALVAYIGDAAPGGPVAQAAACTALRAVLRDAGLAGEPDLRPGSVRQWAGRRRYDAGRPIHEVALALGHRSLDETATDIGLRWRLPAAANGGNR